MQLVAQIILNLAIAYYFIRKIYFWFFANKEITNLKKQSKSLRSQAKRQLSVNKDLYSCEQVALLLSIKLFAENFNAANADDNAKKELLKQQSLLDSFAITHSNSFFYEIADTLIIAFAIAFGARSLYLQPFKIPTGSMQPTLFGIHNINGGNEVTPSKPRQIFDYINYSYRYPTSRVPLTGKIIYQRNVYRLPDNSTLPVAQLETTGKKSFLTYETNYLNIYMQNLAASNNFAVPVSLPGAFGNSEMTSLAFYLAELKDKTILANTNLINQRNVTGDHLFVDRITFNFRDPKRGDITVFLTDDFPAGTMAGRHYIKRLVGMPGDTIKLVDGKLFVREQGKDTFRVVDGKDHPAFDKMYSQKGGYHGYTAEGCFALNQETFNFTENGKLTTYKQMPFKTVNGEFTIPEDFYFMMGDNSQSSRDSRFFGPVPRKNIVGRAAFCWWPFSRRWGIIDSKEPSDFPSSSTRFNNDFEKQ